MSLLLSFGKKLTDKVEKLESMLPAQIHEMICTDEALRDLTARLRRVLRMSVDSYRRQKTLLPYFSCAQFKPPQRHSKNFVSTSGLVLDIDKLDGKVSAFRQILERDERVLLSFVSPSGKGLKLLFAFSEPISDTALYAAYYKRFAAGFARQYQMEGHVDLKTCDAVRACFLAHDPNAYYNPLAVAIETPASVSASAPLVVEEPTAAVSDPEQEALDEATYRAIIKRLGGRAGRAKPPKPEPYVPSALQAVVEDLAKAWEKYDIKVEKITDIQYGKKFELSHGKRKAELNIYYGKRGFSVVATPKTGTHPKLTELCVRIAEQELYI